MMTKSRPKGERPYLLISAPSLPQQFAVISYIAKKVPEGVQLYVNSVAMKAHFLSLLGLQLLLAAGCWGLESRAVAEDGDFPYIVSTLQQGIAGTYQGIRSRTLSKN